MDVRISRLRTKLREDPKNPRLIKTIYGAGYIFLGDVVLALLRLVDHIDAAFAAHDLAIAMTRLQRAERVGNLHGALLSSRRGVRALGYVLPGTPGGGWWARQGSNL
jgi:hypothetical protein